MRVSLAVTAGLIGALVMPGADLHAAWHGRLSTGNDFAFRGISQTREGPALSGLLQYEHADGFYAALWAGRVDYVIGPERDVELDAVLGYSFRARPSVTIDMAVTRYTYPGADTVRDYDWTEWYTSAHFGSRWIVGVGLGRNWLRTDDTTVAAELTHRYPLPARWLVDVTAGYQTLTDADESYAYYAIGLSRGLGERLMLQLELTGTDDRGRRRFGNSTETRWIGTLSWHF